MKISQQVIVKRWKPILEEYEKIQNKGTLNLAKKDMSC